MLDGQVANDLVENKSIKTCYILKPKLEDMNNLSVDGSKPSNVTTF